MKTYAKKIASLFMTAVFAASMLATTAAADDKKTGFKKPEDDSVLTTYPDGKKEPTLSFDTKDCLNYITVTEDGVNEAGITVERQTKVRYQGGCLLISADNKTVRTGTPANPDDTGLGGNGAVVNIEGADGLPYVYNKQMGIQIDASSFGLENFDGCVISMMVKFHPDAVAALDTSSMQIYASDADGKGTGSRTIQFSELEAKGFRSAMLTVMEPEAGKRGDTASFTITLPFTAAYKGPALYIDNLIIQTPLKDGDNKIFVKNVDGYNASASVDNTDTAIQVGENITTESVVLESVPDEAGEGGKGVIVIIVVVAVVLVIAIGIVVFLKMKNRFY